MLSLNIILFCCLSAGLLLVVRGVFINRANRKDLESISDELLSLYKQTAQTKKILEKKIDGKGAPLNDDINSPVQWFLTVIFVQSHDWVKSKPEVVSLH